MEKDASGAGRRRRLNRLQVVETEHGLLLKRGRTVVRVEGEASAQIAQALLAVAAEGEATAEELCAPFPPPLRPSVAQLIEALEARRLLADAAQPEPAEETPLDVFYWHFGRQREEVARNLARARITVLGVNCVSRRLVAALLDSGLDTVETVDWTPFGNVRLFRRDGTVDPAEWPERLGRPVTWAEWAAAGREAGCLVATTDFGGQQLLREWNRRCVATRTPFLPVVLQDLVGTVGPLVIPGESACLECLRARENAQMEDPEARRAAEHAAYPGQVVNAFHPSMASILGDLAAVEIVKFHGQLMRSSLVGNLIEANLAIPEIRTRRVLKLPRCEACGVPARRSPVSDDRVTAMPGHEAVR
jgi:bacteriocin biosynthesis cyclodehydratase domain-containing protein